jgi:hypothetical protein
MIWSRNEPFVREKPIVAFVDGVETPHSVMLSNSRVAFNEEGKKTVPEGIFICRIGSEFHCLPRAKATAAFSTTSNAGSIDLSRLFTAGDVLTVIEGHQVVTFSGTWNANSVIEITLPTGAKKSLTLGAGTGVVSLPTVALILANYINSDPVASGFMFASPMGNSTYIYNKHELAPPEIALSTNNGGTLTVDSKGSFSMIGTILKVDTSTGSVMLTENSQVNVPVGAHVGVVVDEVYGVYPHAMDLTNKPKFAVAPVSGAHGIYEGALPYFDNDLRRRFPKILFAFKF